VVQARPDLMIHHRRDGMRPCATINHNDKTQYYSTSQFPHSASIKSQPSILLMERPAKRPRLLKTVEVDEADPDYARAEQETTQRFKANWEAILEKYGNENLDQGDEIDLVTGEVVVDRGHLRGMEDGCDDTNQFLMDFVTEELDEDSADELAPEHPPKKLIAKGTEEEHVSTDANLPAFRVNFNGTVDC